MNLLGIDVLAQNGVFVKPGTLVDGKVAVSTEYCQQPYTIRNAAPTDLEKLMSIEKKCWESHIRQKKETIANRIRSNVGNQWIISYDGEVAGVLYTQLIQDPAELLSPGMCYEKHDQLSAGIGDCTALQLLSIAVLPQYQVYQLGSVLRNHMLLRCQWLAGGSPLPSIVAMTRTSEYAKHAATVAPGQAFSTQMYQEYVVSSGTVHARGAGDGAAPPDPTLRFHLCAGATVLHVVPGYREADVDNCGHAVMVGYDLPAIYARTAAVGLNEAPERANVPGASPAVVGTVTAQQAAELEESLVVAVRALAAEGGSSVALDRTTILQTPFMQLGLSSLHMMELHSVVGNAVKGVSGGLGRPLSLSSTLVFDHPSLQDLLVFLLHSLNYSEGAVKPVSASPSATSALGDSKFSSVVGMACRFPGGSNDPFQFYSSLCLGMDAVKLAPSSWQMVDPVAGVGSTDEDLAARLSLLDDDDDDDEVDAEQEQGQGISGGDGAFRYAGFLDDAAAETFDPQFFHISMAEARTMDPHQRLLLEVAYEALLDAHLIHENIQKGCAPDPGVPLLPNNRSVGVFIGMSNTDWVYTQSKLVNGNLQANVGIDYGAIDVHANADPAAESVFGKRGRDGSIFSNTPTSTVFETMNTSIAAAANRISYVFGLTGPSMIVDTACSSSLVALHQACAALHNGDCEYALVGGADLLISKHAIEIREASQMLSFDGKCRTFDMYADGYVRGEGVACIVLKKRDLAATSDEREYGIIRGSAINSDGRSACFTAPNALAQRDLLVRALDRAHLNPSDVLYVEAHGTGTSLGDPIECQGIKGAYIDGVDGKASVGSDKPLFIGAVKTNIGHLEAAAGLAGLMKAILSLRYGKIPHNLHFQQLNPLIRFGGADEPVGVRTVVFPSKVGVDIADLHTPVAGGTGPVAGISSFGSGGTNAHVIVEGVPALATDTHASEGSPCVADGDATPEPSKVAFLFTGQGAQYMNMGKELFESNAVFQDVVQRVAAVCAEQEWVGGISGRVVKSSWADCFPLPISEVLFPYSSVGEGSNTRRRSRSREDSVSTPAGVGIVTRAPSTGDRARSTSRASLSSGLQQLLGELGAEGGLSDADREKSRLARKISLLQNDPVYSQLSLYVVEVALAAVWMSRGVFPTAVCGHSLGEYAAAVVAGLFSVEQGARLVLHRAALLKRHLQEQTGSGSGTTGVMYAVRASEEDFHAAVVQAQTRASKSDSAASAVIIDSQSAELDGSVVALACVNSPQSIVVSGSPDSVRGVLDSMSGKTNRQLQVTHGFHSFLVAGPARQFAVDFADLVGASNRNTGELRFFQDSSAGTPQPPSFVSCVTGVVWSDRDQLRAGEYWEGQMLGTVRFADCVGHLRSQMQYTTFLEIGPHSVLTSLTSANIAAMAKTGGCFGATHVLSSLHRDEKSDIHFVKTFNKLQAVITSEGHVAALKRQSGLAAEARAWKSVRSIGSYAPVLLPWRLLKEEQLISPCANASGDHSGSNNLHPIGGRGVAAAKLEGFSEAEHRNRVLAENVSLLVSDIVSSFVVLRGDDYSADDTNLFSLGIDSLAAYEISNRIGSSMPMLLQSHRSADGNKGSYVPKRDDVLLPANLVFRCPSIASIVKFVVDLAQKKHQAWQKKQLATVQEAEPGQDEGGPKRRRSSGTLASTADISNFLSGSTSGAAGIDPAAVESIFPTTSMQRVMLYHFVRQPEMNEFVETFSWHIRGANLSAGAPEFNVGVFRQAWVDAAIIHETLRSSFNIEDLAEFPVQIVWKPAALKLSGEGAGASSTSWFKHVQCSSALTPVVVEEHIQQTRKNGFDVAAPLLFRVVVLEHGGQFVVLLTVHHCLVDGRSMRNILKTLADRYRIRMQQLGTGASDAVVQLPIIDKSSSYSEFATFEQELLAMQHGREDVSTPSLYANMKAFWVKSLASATPNAFKSSYFKLDATTSKLPLKVNCVDSEVIRVKRMFSKEISDLVARAASIHHVTIAALMNTVWCLTYAALVDSEDIMYGCTSSGRTVPIVANPGMIVGPLINTIPYRFSCSDEVDVNKLPGYVHQQLVQYLEHEYFPLSEIQKVHYASEQGAHPERAAGSNPALFSVIFDYQHNAWDTELSRQPAVSMVKSTLIDRIGCPLSFRLLQESGGLLCYVTSEDKNFDRVHVELLLDAYGKCLDILLNHYCQTPAGAAVSSETGVASRSRTRSRGRSVDQAAVTVGQCKDVLRSYMVRQSKMYYYQNAIIPTYPVLMKSLEGRGVASLSCSVSTECLQRVVAACNKTPVGSTELSVYSAGTGDITSSEVVGALIGLALSFWTANCPSFSMIRSCNGGTLASSFQIVCENSLSSEASLAGLCRSLFIQNFSCSQQRASSVVSLAQLLGLSSTDIVVAIHECANSADFLRRKESLGSFSQPTMNFYVVSGGDSVELVAEFSNTATMIPAEVESGIAKSLATIVQAVRALQQPEVGKLVHAPLKECAGALHPASATPVASILRPDMVPEVTLDSRVHFEKGCDFLMHVPFERHSRDAANKGKIAVVSYHVNNEGDQLCTELTYEGLHERAYRLRNTIIARVDSGKLAQGDSPSVVAIMMEKGWEQVVGVLATHMSHCIYLPMDAKLWPESRIRKVLEMSKAVAVLTQGRILAKNPWMVELAVPVVDVNAALVGPSTDPEVTDDKLFVLEPNHLAYLIYTSGSTGVPKGVCCHHIGAMNTILDLNDRFQVKSDDKILALSSLSFDLSVYDIFGMLTAGGCVVLPDANTTNPPDPSVWFDIIVSQQITIWDTVPMLMELLVTYCEFSGFQIPSSLRLIYMSGDWIPITLPSRIRKVSNNPDIRIISMGGATEAAIWSNTFELLKNDNGGIPEGWTSVPYGIPMRNQTMYILNEKLQHCEMWVVGSIYIGGVGVAHGYYLDPERSAYQFITHPVTKEFLFRTGDLGRIRPDDRGGGLLEIMGREDSQVKISGYRIELGEIERVLAKNSLVSSVAVAVHDNTLCAYVVIKPTTGREDEVESQAFKELRATCQEHLTDYMMPKHFMVIDEIPLSSNGKIQREKLPKPESLSLSTRDPTDGEHGAAGTGNADIVLPRTPTQEKLLEVFSAVLRVPASSISVTTNVFSIGLDSLRSLSIVTSARKVGLIISIPQVFDYPTIESLAEHTTTQEESGPAILGTGGGGVKESDYIFTIEKEDIERTRRTYQTEAIQYPMIGINQAHYVGLYTSSFVKGSMTPQIYFEWEIGSPNVLPDPTMKGDINYNHRTQQVNVAALEFAINYFVNRHDTFRSIVRQDGQMEVYSTRDVPWYTITHVNSSVGAADPEAVLKATRKDMTTNGPKVFVWPLFESRVTHTSPTSSVVHFTVSLFLMDAMSDLILRHELSVLYRAYLNSSFNSSGAERILKSSPAGAPPIYKLFDECQQLSSKPKILFTDYCTALEGKLRCSRDYLAAKEFWSKRMFTLPAGPELPMLLSPVAGQENNTGRFSNFHRWLTVDEWRRTKANCAKYAVTIPAMLLAIYAIVLSHWSNKDHFLINVLQCLRHPVHEDVHRIVGNCSSTILCEVDFRTATGKSISFVEAVKRIARELSRNLQYACMSGIEVMQELNRLRGKTFSAVAPFIFTTPIGVENGNAEISERDWIFNETFFSERVPHTACVNAIKADPSGTACASLDIIDGVFADEVTKGVHSSYNTMLDLICSKNASDWSKPIEFAIPEPASCPPISPPDDVRGKPNLLLHEPFIAHTKTATTQARTAVVGYQGGAVCEFTYEEVSRMASVVHRNIMPSLNDCDGSGPPVIAVVMEKGWEQVVGVLATHMSHCIYLPMDAKLWPESRIRKVLEMSKAVAVLTQTHVLEREPWLLQALDLPVVDVSKSFGLSLEQILVNEPVHPNATVLKPDDLAYLIYTSGSTGVPKGVCCHHIGAMNTILDLNDRFQVKSDDKILALSSLSFDLSVYDIFGMLTAGGCVVLPDANTTNPPDPSVWFDIIVSQQITIWNTVPMLMELLVTYCEFSGQTIPSSLRLIYMSGDWIPITLPSRIRKVSNNPDIRIISMGGATEAAIWSNTFELLKNDNGGIPEGWTSVPYGIPMRNQTMYILNEKLQHCEMWVVGSIYIGGVGVAHGYYLDPERSAYQFITHPVTKEALFRTGDLGRMRPKEGGGGLLEIMGREDSQVKISGYRIELGEIERVLAKHTAISSVAVAVHDNTLCAYIVLRDSSEADGPVVDEQQAITELRDICKEQLTDYMMPKYFTAIDEIPLSLNGKIQREKLAKPEALANKANGVASSQSGTTGGATASNGSVGPRDKVEERLVKIYCDLLGISAGDICCKASSFFDLGGNSVMAIKLIYLIKQNFNGYLLPIQTLFVSSTVQELGVIVNEYLLEHPYTGEETEVDSGASAAGGATDSPLSLIELSTAAAEAGKPVMVLFNPAGASALCYMELTQTLKEHYVVVALDDNILLASAVDDHNDETSAPISKPFATINDVVTACLPHIESIAKQFGHQKKSDSGTSYEIVLGGWSYGGVVATLLTQRLHELNSKTDFDGPVITVSRLFLFDSPLFGDIIHSDDGEENKLSFDGKVLEHFKYCTKMLADFYADNRTVFHHLASTGTINVSDSSNVIQKFVLSDVDMVVIRADEAEVEDPARQCHANDKLELYQQLTSTPITAGILKTPGNHWTMLFNPNVKAVADIMIADKV